MIAQILFLHIVRLIPFLTPEHLRFFVIIVVIYLNLYDMAIGTASADRLFVNGQMKVKGNISKGAEMRYLIMEPSKED